jgi:hypothetical protein
VVELLPPPPPHAVSNVARTAAAARVLQVEATGEQAHRICVNRFVFMSLKKQWKSSRMEWNTGAIKHVSV